MADKESDDIKEWLTEVAASDPFERLRKFRAENPDTLILDDLANLSTLISVLVVLAGASKNQVANYSFAPGRWRC